MDRHLCYIKTYYKKGEIAIFDISIISAPSETMIIEIIELLKRKYNSIIDILVLTSFA